MKRHLILTLIIFGPLGLSACGDVGSENSAPANTENIGAEPSVSDADAGTSDNPTGSDTVGSAAESDIGNSGVNDTGAGTVTPSDKYWDDCPADVFLDVTKAPGPGPAQQNAGMQGSWAGGTMPFLEVSCTEDSLVVNTNGLPHYTFIPMTPNDLVVAEHTYTFPLEPQVADETTDIPFLGYVAVAINGVSIFGPNEGAIPDAYGDPMVNNIMDPCHGHTAFEYHHHALEQKCMIDSGLVAEPWTNADVDTTQPSPVLGFAADGFPIYGPHGCLDSDCREVVTFQSAWELKDGATGANYAWDPSDNEGAAAAYSNAGAYHYVAKDDPTYLDKCNGRYGPDGRYRHVHRTPAV